MGGIIEMEVLFSVSQSYLTQLWSNDVFQKKIEQKHKSITDKVSQYFTPALLLLAFGSLIFWLFINANLAFNVFTAVLIVACPCALALTAPFTLGNVLRIMGNHKLYLKNAQVIEQIAKVDTIVFDKTGTITSSLKSTIEYTGTDLSDKELANIKSIVRNSNHPLSRKLYAFLPQSEIVVINLYEEIIGKGMLASVENSTYKIGSLHLMNLELEIEKDKNTKVHIEIDSEYKGYFAFNHQYREGLNTLFKQLDKNNYKTVVLSGDNDGEKVYLQSVLPQNTTLVFHQKPEQKLDYIQKLQNEGKNVMMVGDGLNDAGALAQSNIGIALSENVNVFSPACDGIMDASQFQKLFHYIQYSKNAMKTIYMSFGLSLLYNSVGLAFALTGKLSPLFAAIIMPMSAITIVSFVTILSKFYGKKIKS
jgi:Cu+-exporting ATPase